MWQAKYALAVPKNLGLGLNFRLYSEGYFLSGRPQSMGDTFVMLFFHHCIVTQVGNLQHKSKTFFIFSFPSSKLEVYNFLTLKLAMQIWFHGLLFMDFFSWKKTKSTDSLRMKNQMPSAPSCLHVSLCCLFFFLIFNFSGRNFVTKNRLIEFFKKTSWISAQKSR